jgi:hypothetical protein
MLPAVPAWGWLVLHEMLVLGRFGLRGPRRGSCPKHHRPSAGGIQSTGKEFQRAREPRSSLQLPSERSR